jgi:DNA-binding NtrC family response regulator
MRRILIVDDEPNFREPLAGVLRQHYEVWTAASAEEVLAQIHADGSQCPDALVVDVMLGSHVSGVELATSIYALCPRVRTVLVTGFPPPPSQKLVGTAGIVAIVEKPCDVDTIRNALNLPPPP